MAGRLIACCGIDGSGKSTQVERLAERCREQGLSVKVLRFLKRQSEFFQDVERLMDAMSWQTYCELIAFERHRRICRLVPRALERYDVVICDRYHYTDLAYPAAYDCSTGFLEALVNAVPVPHAKILFDIEPERALLRVNARGETFAAQENLHTLGRARDAFLQLAVRYGFEVVDADRTAEEVAADVWERAGLAAMLHMERGGDMIPWKK